MADENEASHEEEVGALQIAAPIVPTARTAPIRDALCLSATCKPRRAPNSGISERDGKAKAEEAVNAAVADLRDIAFPMWYDAQIVRSAIATKEFGKNKGGAHIQFGSVELTTLSLSETVKRLKARLMERLKRHNAGGIILWSVREVHEHDDMRLLGGYCFKEHVRFASISMLVYAVVGTLFTVAYLKDAYKYWLSRASQNEGGEASLNILRPGQHTGTHTVTRQSLLGDVEYFKHDRGFGPLRLTVAKIMSHMVSQEYAQLHAMFASGVGASSGPPHPVLQNLWLQVRETPHIAGSILIMNKLLYGPNYDTANDKLIDEALAGVVDGPTTAVTNDMSYAECVLAVRCGELRDGTPLQQTLVGYVARSYVISLGGALAAAHDCSRMLASMSILVSEHISSIGLDTVGDRIAALAARLLATSASPTSLTPADITVRLTHPELLTILDTMLFRTGQSPQALSDDELLSAVTAIAPDEARTEHPWLMRPVHINCTFREDVVPYRGLQGLVQASTVTYELGPPAWHVCIVEAGGQHFVCAWQMTLQRMRALELSRPLPGVGISPAADGAPAAARARLNGQPATASLAGSAMARAQAAVQQIQMAAARGGSS